MKTNKEINIERPTYERNTPNRAAAENKHTLVKGRNKGTDITKTTIVHENPLYYKDQGQMMVDEEHHNDPPSTEQDEKTTMREEGRTMMAVKGGGMVLTQGDDTAVDELSF